MYTYKESAWFENLVFLKTLLLKEIRQYNKNKRKGKQVKQGRRGRPSKLGFDYKRDKEALTKYKLEKNMSYPDRYCRCCDRDVKYLTWYQHIKGKKHLFNMSKFTENKLLEHLTENSEILGV